jgi:hypothetical protein
MITVTGDGNVNAALARVARIVETVDQRLFEARGGDRRPIDARKKSAALARLGKELGHALRRIKVGNGR